MQADPVCDVCLILEGTYPYISGGVSSWVHELILEQPHLNFCLVCLSPPGHDKTHRYKIPDNVIAKHDVTLQQPSKGRKESNAKTITAVFEQLKTALESLHSTETSLDALKMVSQTIRNKRNKTYSSDFLLNSKGAWQMLINMYYDKFPNSSFINYFWSWRAIMSSMLSVMLAKLPPAKVYHSICTGYGGLYLARARVERECACLLTEHGIYTNERRIELASAAWLDDEEALRLDISKERKELRDFWMDAFFAYSKLAYDASDRIVTLYKGNQQLQKEDGADPDKLMVIPNGINVETFGSIKRQKHRPPTVALIGRVVPIKDVKAYIMSIAILSRTLPNVKAYMLGPTDEDPVYYDECKDLVASQNIQDNFTFEGKVDVKAYLDKIDIMVLSSLSEAQPLVVLECGASGVVPVTTDVGACREMIEGNPDEDPKIGQGGIVCELSNPRALAEAMERLFVNKKLYDEYAHNISTRVKRYYEKADQHKAYKELYDTLMKSKGF